MKNCHFNLKAGSDQEPTGITHGEPFAGGTGGSENFRIPALITLRDGSLMAAADARYATTGDGGGLDTIVSISNDQGKTWQYSYPIYFPDSDGYAGAAATTVIDPVLAQGADGTVYLMADVNPTGVTTMRGYTFPGRGTGYITVDGVARLALTDHYENVSTVPSEDDLSTYGYYVGDFDEEGYAGIISRLDGSVFYAVDACYNLYKADGNGIYIPLTQRQVNTSVMIQQNVFYAGSDLHVYNTGYLWLACSLDSGKTWRHKILSPQIKRDNEIALLISPGRGTLLHDGTVLIPFYTWDYSVEGCQQSTFIYSKDNGQTWMRADDVPLSNGWSSESEMVELADGTLRMFVRNGSGTISYADAAWSEATGRYVWRQAGGIVSTGIAATSTCNISAVRYSHNSNGCEVILVACPGNGERRSEGKIFVFLLDEDKSMMLAGTFQVTDSHFSYCCLTELDDGRVAILWESGSRANEIRFDVYEIDRIVSF